MAIPKRSAGKISKDILKDLTAIPGIGPSLAHDLYDLGFKSVHSLKNRDPEKMYRDLCILRNFRLDPCVLYTFRCAVYFASTPKPKKELLLWWNWKNQA